MKASQEPYFILSSIVYNLFKIELNLVKPIKLAQRENTEK